MLVIGRDKNEQIYLRDRASGKLLGVLHMASPETGRIGLAFPANVRIERAELSDVSSVELHAFIKECHDENQRYAGRRQSRQPG